MSGGLRFVRPQGAVADQKELEYVISLHQTCADNTLRANATVSSHDIMALLKSRYGLMNVTHKEALDIVSCFGGDRDSLMHDDEAHEKEQKRRELKEHAVQVIQQHLHPIIKQRQRRQREKAGERNKEDANQRISSSLNTLDLSRSTSSSSSSSMIDRSISISSNNNSEEMTNEINAMVHHLDEFHQKVEEGLHQQQSFQDLKKEVQNKLRRTVMLQTKAHHQKQQQERESVLQRVSTITETDVSDEIVEKDNRDDSSVESVEIQFDKHESTTRVEAETQQPSQTKTWWPSLPNIWQNNENSASDTDMKHTKDDSAAATSRIDNDGVATFASYEFASFDNNNNKNKNTNGASLTLQEEIALRDVECQIQASEATLVRNNSMPGKTRASQLNPPAHRGINKTASNHHEHNNNTTQHSEQMQHDQHVTGYLDLVQILATILLPTFARLAQDWMMNNNDQGNDNVSTNIETTRRNSKDQARVESKRSSRTCDEDTNENDTSTPWKRLHQRFVAYGRRKLGITDENQPKLCTSQNFMQKVQLALLKTVSFVGDEEEQREFQNVDEAKHVKAPVVNETLIQLLLISHGEMERANDLELVKEMVKVASSPSGVLDEHALCNALTFDLVDVWDPGCETHAKTFLYDILGEHFPSLQTKLRLEEDDKTTRNKDVHVLSTPRRPDQSTTTTDIDIESLTAQEPCEDEGKTVRFFSLRRAKKKQPQSKGDFSFLFGGVDMVIDAAASLLILLLIWLSFVFFVLIYGSLVLSQDVDINCDINDWWCVIVGRLISWLLISTILLTCGVALVIPLSVGNNPAGLSPGRTLFSMVYATSNALVPYLVTGWLQENPDKLASSGLDKLIETQYYKSAQKMLLASGCFLALLYLCLGMFTFFVGHDNTEKLPLILRLMFSATSYTGEVRIFRAAKFKAERMVSNALALHECSEIPNTTDWKEKVAVSRATDPAIKNYICKGERQEEIGGLLFCLWKLVDGSLLDEEGVWLHSRLLVIQVAQVGITLFIVVVLLLVEERLASDADNLRSTLEPFFLPDYIMEIFPTGEMIHAALAPAVCIAFGFTAAVIALYIPSSIATILKYRGGLLPSLGSKSFQKFRQGVDMTYVNTANALYGLFAMALLVYLATGFFVFLFVWPVSKSGMLQLVTTAAGIAITVVIKTVATSILNKRHYRSFYRIRPAAARVTSLALECWQLGLASTVAMIRIAQYLIAALFWIGRIDVPFLSEEVVLFGVSFDTVPQFYVKDLLVHEAHRHPYIERLCQMYLMKIRYRDRFISPAGSAWRQLVVSALFPWLQKYRVFGGERRFHAEREKSEIEAMEQRRENHHLQVGEELLHAQKDVTDGFRRASRMLSKTFGRRRRRTSTSFGMMDSSGASSSVAEEVGLDPINQEPYGLVPSWN